MSIKVDELGFILSQESYQIYLEEVPKKQDQSKIWNDYLKSLGDGTGLENINKIKKNEKIIKRMVRNGVPADLRGPMWMHFTGAKQRKTTNEHIYDSLLYQFHLTLTYFKNINGELQIPKAYKNIFVDIHECNRWPQPSMVDFSEKDRKRIQKFIKIVDLIERDLLRTFPENQYFKSTPFSPTPNLSREPSVNNSVCDMSVQDAEEVFEAKDTIATLPRSYSYDDLKSKATRTTGNMIASLRRVLIAFAVYAPSIGYCQSLNYLVGMLLLHMSEEDAFWMLVTIVFDVLPPFVYAPGLRGVILESKVVRYFLTNKTPNIMRRIEPHIHLESLSANFLMTLFVNVLPPSTLCRFWDCFFYEGIHVFYRMMLTVFVLANSEIKKMPSYKLNEFLQKYPRQMKNSNDAIDKLIYYGKKNINITERDVIYVRQKIMRDENSDLPGIPKFPKRGKKLSLTRNISWIDSSDNESIKSP
eukprot:NODE_43_length_28809_cov_0.237200.p7 type:complete len:472 gc:universal NODE_43_length_28809_cov_0.237200:5198-6613(+)